MENINKAPTQRRPLLLTQFSHPKLVASGHDLLLEPPQIFQESSFKFLQKLYPSYSLEDLLSEDAIEVNLDEDDFCDKYDRHNEYIAVNDFSLEHLPSPIKHIAVYIWLRNVAPFVVRLKRDGNATGRICILDQEKNKSKICDDVHCQFLEKLGRNHNVYGGLGIITNKHVIKSDCDAAMTRVDFFYNDENSPPIYTELGNSLQLSDTRFDYSVFSCYVHDKLLLEMVKVLDSKRDYAWLRIPPRIRTLTQQYAIIISHPHGKAKKISIGMVKETEVKGKNELANISASALRVIYNLCEKQGSEGLKRFLAYYNLQKQELPFRITWYTTATCKGSSGAPVYMGNIVTENGQEKNLAHTHRGVDKNKHLNVCFT
ncbi:hypothetical protein BgiMline_004564 [Biomphalaria glabrata]|uniref:Uncharacterized protein LOC106055119 n=1 Tax=Biomphalaria glabrata TaxID=6526 RepID=A0A2C9LXK8_BIOGL|nr:uncharacterized protein LOC106055119 [Biomphalaria glabrata]XP_055877255.1 uncharacterized protein LOC106055119 [Biomphalaria glabrata]KAI8765000.1 hypothetical protein BgiMline_002670 [Biomphalaria glabrata]KAI8796929.1 hypothetical protein BgiBS90_002106 [Biomphalaria glabrata]